MTGVPRFGLTGGLVHSVAIAIAAAIAIFLMSDICVLAQPASRVFTQAQVTAGREDYLASCAACHGTDLAGGGDAPPLTGENFAFDWSKRTVREFYQFISTTMPDGLAGDLSPNVYSNIVSFLLAANGATPGSTPFNGRSDVRIGAIANGQIVPAVVNGGKATVPFRKLK